jgi:hypothetical protein
MNLRTSLKILAVVVCCAVLLAAPSALAQDPRLPDTLLMGHLRLTVVRYDETPTLERVGHERRGLSGIAWLKLDCERYPRLSLRDVLDRRHLRPVGLEIVPRVADPETEISLETARLVAPEARLGDVLELDERAASVLTDALHPILRTGMPDVVVLPEDVIPVRFTDVLAEPVAGRPRVARVTEGSGVFPVPGRDQLKRTITLRIGGFEAIVTSIEMTPRRALADIILELPPGLASADDCGPATLDLGRVKINRDCQFYIERPDDEYGPWIVGNTGLIVSGTGYIVDFSRMESPPAQAAAWEGVALKPGVASGEELVPLESNTGYLATEFSLGSATITAGGLSGQLLLSAPHEFQASHPVGYVLAVGGGSLVLEDNDIVTGQFGPGHLTLPPASVCVNQPNQPLRASIATLAVQSDLDLFGEVDFGADARFSWGELTKVGREQLVWTSGASDGYLYLPSQPGPSYTPDTGSGFEQFQWPSSSGDAAGQMEQLRMAGVLLRPVDSTVFVSRDIDSGSNAPGVFELSMARGWLRVGCAGVDGHLDQPRRYRTDLLGNPRRDGYVSPSPFEVEFVGKGITAFKFASSAVYESRIDGFIKLGPPCDIDALEFIDMETTSTGDLVGGDVVLPPGGVELSYWQIALVPTSSATAGVLSTRTGRILFTAAGLWEPVHFSRPFLLSWGEILADGNVGELMFDYNPYGQRFDGFSYSPHTIALSRYVPGTTDPYLGTSGDVHFAFFGSAFANVRDAVYPDSTPTHYQFRRVTVPDRLFPDWDETDLALHGEWDGGRAVFDFANADMSYHLEAQNGFLGDGESLLSFIGGGEFEATIEMHADEIDISLLAQNARHLNVGLFTQLGSMGELTGCVRIVGPTLERIHLSGYLEQWANVGGDIIGAEASQSVEAMLSVTPSTCDFFASGDLVLAVATASVNVQGSIYLGIDFDDDSVEGNVSGLIDCRAILYGLKGYGQFTWYADPTSYYVQGAVGIEINSWAGSGLEGGLFVGMNAPKDRIWVFTSGHPTFRFNEDLIPADTVTGFYGYGQVSEEVNLYILSGGIDVFAGAGMLVGPVDGVAATDLNGVGVYVIGSAGAYLHGEILGGVVSASAWVTMDAVVGVEAPPPVIVIYFEGEAGLEACVVWVICASVDVTVGLSPDDGFYVD